MPNNEPDWGSASIGIATFATILAAAASAGIFAVTARQESYSELTRSLAASLSTISLLAYAAVLTFSLAALFGKPQAARRALALWAARAVLAQAYTVALAVILLLHFPLLDRMSG